MSERRSRFIKKVIAFVTSLGFISAAVGVSAVMAAITFTATSMTGDSSFVTLTGATSTTFDVGSGNTLSLQTTNNGGITAGTGTFTINGLLSVLNIDRSGPIAIGTSSATGITIGRSGQTVTFPGTALFSGLFTATSVIPVAGLATTTAANIIVANGSGVPAYVALSGDATISNAGALSLAATNTNLTTLNNISNIDRLAAGTLSIGTATTTGITIGRSGQTVTLPGNQLVTGPLLFSATGAVIDSNASGTLLIGNSTTTVITIGRSGQTVTMPGNLTVSGTFSPTITSLPTLSLTNTTNQLVLGTATTTTITATTPAASRTYTIPDNSTASANFVLAPTSATSTFSLFATATAGAPAFRAIALGDLPTQTGSGSIVLGTGPTLTSPLIVTNIKDTNGNAVLAITATANATDTITIANSATGNAPSLSATGADTNISLNLIPKGTGGIQFNSGTPITKHNSATASLNFGAVAANACAEQSMTVTGANVGDTVALGPPSSVSSTLSWSGYISGSGTSTIRLCNVSATIATTTSATWRVDDWQH